MGKEDGSGIQRTPADGSTSGAGGRRGREHRPPRAAKKATPTPPSEPERRAFPLPTPLSKIEFRPITEELQPYVNYDLPIVNPGSNNVSVIGVHHLSIPRNPEVLPENFTSTLAAARHILLEGSPLMLSGTYEAIAVTIAAAGMKPIRFLETDSGDPVRVLEAAGMPPQVAAFFIMNDLITSRAREIHDDNGKMDQTDLANAIARLIPISRTIATYFQEKTDRQLTKLFSGWIRNVGRHIRQWGGSEGLAIVQHYEARIRDSEMFSAENMAALHNLPGAKTIIVGEDHLFPVLQALEGKYPQKPLPWRKYIEQLSQEEKEAISALYGLAY